MPRPTRTLLATALILCCVARTTAARAADKPPADPAREIVFRVGSLGCTLVEGVGCGHLLAPLLAELDRADGVAHSSINWTGTRLRVTVAPAADRARVAAAGPALLADRGYAPVRLAGDELAKTLGGEDWRGVGRVAELSSYEF